MSFENIECCNLCGNNQLKVIDSVCNISTCKDCGYIVDNPRPTLESLVRFYSQPTKYDHWLTNSRARDSLWRRRVKKMNRVGKAGSLLDVGTGIGQFLHHASGYYSECCGTEVSESAIKIAKEKYNLSILNGEVTQIQFGKDQTFDNITLFHVLEHVPNPRQVIECCSSLLKKDGILIVAVPNEITSTKTRIKRLLSWLGIKKFGLVGKYGLPKLVLDGSLKEIHLSHFTPQVLEKFLKKMGFEIIENSLDPYYVASGFRSMFHRVYYTVSSFILWVSGKNIYDTIWVAVKKR